MTQVATPLFARRYLLAMALGLFAGCFWPNPAASGSRRQWLLPSGKPTLAAQAPGGSRRLGLLALCAQPRNHAAAIQYAQRANKPRRVPSLAPNFSYGSFPYRKLPVEMPAQTGTVPLDDRKIWAL